MPTAFVILLFGMVLAAIARVVSKPERIFEYPYFMAVVFGGFIGVQGLILIRVPLGATDEWIAKALLMACLCLMMCILGYRERNKSVESLLCVQLDAAKFFRAGLFLVAVSYVFSFLTAMTDIEERNRTQWTGKLTIYAFFAGLLYPGFAICLQSAIQRGKAVAWAATAAATLPIVFTIVLAGRREPAMNFLFTGAFTLFHVRGVRPSRGTILCAIVIMTLVVPVVGEYRGVVAKAGLTGARDIDVVGAFKRYFDNGSILELRNASFLMEAVGTSGQYGLGRGYWDTVIFRFIPAQILGRDFKEGLMFESSGEETSARFDQVGYTATVGSTITGVGDSFSEFGYFGCLIFALIGSIMRSIWTASRTPNSGLAAVLHSQLAIGAMIAATHQTYNFVPDLIYFAIFFVPLALYAKERRNGSRPAR